jgi:CubicO group peptidase (beta-lactamase class C family)
VCVHVGGEKVVDIWGFAAAGKSGITVAQLMSHQAGLPTVDDKLPLEQILEWDPIVEALAAHAPMWEPGTAFGYVMNKMDSNIAGDLRVEALTAAVRSCR